MTAILSILLPFIFTFELRRTRLLTIIVKTFHIGILHELLELPSDVGLYLGILCYTFCIVIKHLELLYMLQTIIVWKEFELDTCFVFYLWNVWIFFYKCVVEINVLFKCEVLIM